MLIKQLSNGLLQSNSFIIGRNGEGVLIDAGAPPQEVLAQAKDLGLKIRYIILTHCHVDHIWYTDELKKLTNAKVCIHQLDANAISDKMQNLSYLMGEPIEIKNPDILLKDGDILTVGDYSLEIIHTPGHSEGGICIRCEEHIFTGDTLFKGSWGRTDFPGGSNSKLLASIHKILDHFDGETVLHSGHGADTTILEERRNNPYKEFL